MEPAERQTSESAIQATVVALAVAVFGLAMTQLTTLPAVILEPALEETPAEASVTARAGFFALNFLGFVAAGAIYLHVTDRGWAYVDLAFPSERDWWYLLVGIVGSVLLFVLVNVVITLLQPPAAESQVIEFVGDDPTMVLVMIAIVLLFNAPAEEFLFRNIVQKRLYDAIGTTLAVVVASLIFALVHLPVYALTADSTVAVATSLSIIFAGSLFFGALYAHSGNLIVPIGAHAAFNAIQFGLLYLTLELGLEETGPATSGVIELIAVLG